jgi:hypothetical protein
MASVLIWLEASPTQTRKEIRPGGEFEHMHVAGNVADEKWGQIF